MTLERLMGQPYLRIVLLHLTIIFGAVPTILLGSPMGMLIVLILLKIVIDVALHTKSRKQRPAPE